jgi:hypothetical protein
MHFPTGHKHGLDKNVLILCVVDHIAELFSRRYGSRHRETDSQGSNGDHDRSLYVGFTDRRATLKMLVQAPHGVGQCPT